MILGVGLSLGFTGCQGKSKPVTPAKSTTTKAAPSAPSASSTTQHKSEVLSKPASTNPIDKPAKSIAKVVAPPSMPGGDQPIPTQNQVIHTPEVDSALLARAKELGLNCLISERVIFWTDLPVEKVARYPQMIMELVHYLDQKFKPTLLDEANRNRIFTGHLVANRKAFDQLELMPTLPFSSEHGTYYKGSFWVSDQEVEYYRRHLILHEMVHAYMMAIPNNWPACFTEGFAELIATHRELPDGHFEFGVFPENLADYPGWYRIQSLHSELAAGRFKTLDQTLKMQGNEFPGHIEPYAWSWAWAMFMTHYPDDMGRMLELCEPQPVKNFLRQFDATYSEYERQYLELNWKEFISHLQPGYDLRYTWLPQPDSKDVPPPISTSLQFEIKAQAGWQNPRCFVEAGQMYKIHVTGTVTLDQIPMPWVSEPQGLTLRYADGHPIGTILTNVYSPTDAGPIFDGLTVQAIGVEKLIEPVRNGYLYFRVADFWNKIDDNQGSYRVTIEKISQ